MCHSSAWAEDWENGMIAIQTAMRNEVQQIPNPASCISQRLSNSSKTQQRQSPQNTHIKIKDILIVSLS